VVPRELVQEQHRRAVAGLLDIEPDSVVGAHVRHRPSEVAVFARDGAGSDTGAVEERTGQAPVRRDRPAPGALRLRLDLAVAADTRVASSGARIQVAGPGHGLAVAACGLPSLVGRGRAMELCLTMRAARALDALSSDRSGNRASRSGSTARAEDARG
jgi:hypothetical protein